jgi:hypothetical protein
MTTEEVSRQEEDDCTGWFQEESWESEAQPGRYADMNWAPEASRIALLAASSWSHSWSDVADHAPATNVCARSWPNMKSSEPNNSEWQHSPPAQLPPRRRRLHSNSCAIDLRDLSVATFQNYSATYLLLQSKSEGKRRSVTSVTVSLIHRTFGWLHYCARKVAVTLPNSPRISVDARSLRFLSRRFGFVPEMLIVEDRVEYQRVGAHGLASVDRIIAEQQYISLSQVRIHHHGMLGN